MFGWIVWFGFLLSTLTLLATWSSRKRDFLDGESMKLGEIVMIAATPLIVALEGLVLLVILFIDVSKLHLLWVSPAIGLLAILRSSRIVNRELDSSKPVNDSISQSDIEVEATCDCCGSSLVLDEAEINCGSYVCPVCGSSNLVK